MTAVFGGVVDTLEVQLGGRRLRIVTERRGPQGAPLWLLLPALSTVSSRSEWQPLVMAVQDRVQLVSFDWPGFGDSDRPALAYDVALLGGCLEAVLTDLTSRQAGPLTLVAAGHSAAVALALAGTWSDRWSRFVAVAPTWRGPLPTMTGWSPGRFGWLRRLVALPLIGPALYRLNTSRAMLRLMLRRHVWLDPGLLTPDRLRQQQRLARRRGSRFASSAFVSGGLDAADERGWWLEQARCLQCPFHVVLATAAPPRSTREMELLAQTADAVTHLPGRLGLHQEFGALLGQRLLEALAS
ncbi:alpha/beta hydrolase [Cyanobium gracile UHCC 0139]|uniref:Alpha/beta hydrolase n=1 Tax=Cyanobium gracile UHCC 0139 TaxID=3110308 RepID=A0ABU5RSN7_9CYAN|nr:alpha/beta hydrolase [Cyanobium gracile]MEA5390809.1 alpha/beta hydrolase [Cyanobium gracile UHCC 0139]